MPEMYRTEPREDLEERAFILALLLDIVLAWGMSNACNCWVCHRLRQLEEGLRYAEQTQTVGMIDVEPWQVLGRPRPPQAEASRLGEVIE